MQQQRRRSGLIIGLVALGLVAGMALTAGPAQAVDAVGPYYALPSWDQKMAADLRFVVLTNWGSAAVLDKETGLVWERSPYQGALTWIDARSHCTNDVTVGQRKGWRLPSVHELNSLVDPYEVDAPTLPPGHPFLNIALGDGYWSETTVAGVFANVWIVQFFDDGSGFKVAYLKSSAPYPLAWCVRGGNNELTY